RRAEGRDYRGPAFAAGARMDSRIGDDLDVTLRQRGEEQQPGARRGAVLDAGGEMQARQLAGMGALDVPGNEMATQAGKLEHQRGGDEENRLGGKDRTGAPFGNDERQQAAGEQRDERRPEQRIERVAVAARRDDDDELGAAARLDGGNRFADALAIGRREQRLHHCPDAPPPPNDPPPPEKPPPEKPPKPPPEEPRDAALHSAAPATVPSPPPRKKKKRRTMNRKMIAMKTSGARSSFASGTGPAPRAGAAPVPPSATSIAEVPSMMPRANCPWRKAGTMSRSMMLRLSASVSLPSRPEPTSMRTARSFGATMRSAPVFLPFSPIPQARPRR